MTTTGVDVQMSEGAARRLTAEIRLIAGSVFDQIERLKDLVDQAEAGNAHRVLGFPSWTAYLTDVLHDQKLALRRADRQELVGYLSEKGMSTRAIAGAVNASKNTVTVDLQVSHSGTPATAVPMPQAPRTTGLDGRSYPSRPAQAPVRRSPLPDAFRRAVYKVTKATEGVARLAADDRFAANAKGLSQSNMGDLVRARDALQAVIDRWEGAPTLEPVSSSLQPTDGIVIEVGSNTAIVTSGWPHVRTVLQQLGIASMKDHDTRKMAFPAARADDVQAAMEMRHQQVELRRNNDQ